MRRYTFTSFGVFVCTFTSAIKGTCNKFLFEASSKKKERVMSPLNRSGRVVAEGFGPTPPCVTQITSAHRTSVGSLIQPYETSQSTLLRATRDTTSPFSQKSAPTYIYFSVQLGEPTILAKSLLQYVVPELAL